MVSLPQLKSYSEENLQEFNNYSSLFYHYLNLTKKAPQNFSDSIRIKKHTHWLECAFATLSGQYHSQSVCEYWSQESDKIITEAWQHCGLDLTEVGLFAMGKLGSKELNLSSDIDVFFVRGNQVKSKEINLKIKNFIQLLSNNTNFGFAYRVDTNLRPGGELSPLTPSLSHFFNFFDEYAEAWNRMSFIRLRPVIGPSDLNEKVVGYCQRLSYPRRLDFSVIQEIKNIRTKLEYQWKTAPGINNIKYRKGGIRDLELYIQALQVIYGGRHPNLRTHSIRQATHTLKKMDIINEKDFNFVENFYWHLRTIENHIHIFEDKHTYTLRDDVLLKLKRLTNKNDLELQFSESSKIIDGFFVDEKKNSKTKGVPADLSTESQKSIADILNLKSHSLKKSDNEKRKRVILENFLEHANRISIDTNLAINIFRDFIFSIKSKSSIFHLLERHDELLENLAWLFSISPYVGQVLCRRPELLDSFALGKVDIDPNEDIEVLMENLIDYKFLGQLVGIIYFLRNQDIDIFTQQLTTHAETIVKNLLNHFNQQFESKGMRILCMGKWSGFELGVQSDLDFVFLTDKPSSEHQRKLARRFLNLLSTATKAGKLYDFDLRLRPNENAGPLIIENEKLNHFIQNKAQPWQKQAYLRSRILGQENYYFKDNLESLKLNKSDSLEIQQIQSKLLTSASKLKVDLKLSRGGLVHTELSVQASVLANQSIPLGCSTQSLIQSLELPDKDKSQIISNYQFIRKFEQLFQICNSSSSTKVSPQNSNLYRIGKLLKLERPTEALFDVIQRQQELLKKLDLTT